VMIDSLLKHRAAALARPTLEGLGLRAAGQEAPGPYAVVTLHRPANVDDAAWLRGMGEALALLGESMPVIFPVHPRTRARIDAFGLGELFSPARGIRLTEPLGYLDFLNLMAHARLVLTDSGGIQEETTILGVPCMTLRDNTERPVTISEGTNRLVGTDCQRILTAIRQFVAEPPTEHRPRMPELWDGHAAERIVDVVLGWWEGRLTRAA